MNLSMTQIKTAQAIIQIFETGRFNRESYSIVSNAQGDLGGLSYGKAQSTLKSGNLYLLVCAYIRNNGLYKEEFTSYLESLEDRSDTLMSDNNFIRLLRKCGGDNRMKVVQDSFFERLFWNPSQVECAKRGFTLPISACVVYDSFVHGSWKFASGLVNSKNPVDNIEEEKVWIQEYINKRRKWLAENSNLLLRKTTYRLDAIQELINTNSWNLELPLNIRGIIIDIKSLMLGNPSANPVIRNSAESNEERVRILKLKSPPMSGDDVEEIQNLLIDKGYPVTSDGIYGSETEQAIRQFQANNNLFSDGLVGLVTRSALRN